MIYRLYNFQRTVYIVKRMAEAAKIKLLEIVKCPLCLDTFTKPKFLSCHHTFCLDCLETWYKHSRRETTIDCPSCRKEISVPEGNMARLQNDFTKQELIDMLEEGTFDLYIPESIYKMKHNNKGMYRTW